MGGARILLASLLLLVPATALAADPAAFLGDLRARNLQYFLDQSDPASGLVRDRAANFADTSPTNRMASVSATGFAIAAFAQAADSGMLSRAEAEGRILKTLSFVTANLDHHHGWLYHYVDLASGARFGTSEVSTIDTAWLIAGALYAGTIFPDSAISRAADLLYRRLDFYDMLTDGGTKPGKPTLSMGWSPEAGYILWQWDDYAEQMLLLVLGLGHPVKPLPLAAWFAWSRSVVTTRDGEAIMGANQPLFVHQYAWLFLDAGALRCGGFDLKRSTRLAVAANREVALANQTVATFRHGFWGLSAGDGPYGYQAYAPNRFDATACIGCVAGSLPSAPETIAADLSGWASGDYASRIWGRYGFTDSINLDLGWFGTDVIGITVGASYLASANLTPETSVWRRFAAIPAVVRALERLR